MKKLGVTRPNTSQSPLETAPEPNRTRLRRSASATLAAPAEGSRSRLRGRLFSGAETIRSAARVRVLADHGKGRSSPEVACTITFWKLAAISPVPVWIRSWRTRASHSPISRMPATMCSAARGLASRRNRMC